MWNIRLADFGLAKFTDTTLATETSNHNGSVRWMAPELHLPEECDLERYQRTTQSDIYAFACVCLEVIIYVYLTSLHIIKPHYHPALYAQTAILRYRA